MNPNSFSLKDLFPTEALTEARAQAIAKSRDFASSKRAIEKKLKGALLPSGFMAQVIQQAPALLGIELPGILASAWSAVPALHKFLDARRYPTRRSYTVTLAEHAILSEHAPKLRPEVNGVGLGEIPFEVKVEFMLKGVTLIIKGGKIQEAMLGSAAAKGSVKLGDYVLLARETGPVKLPCALTFDPPVPLGATPEAIHGQMGKAEA